MLDPRRSRVNRQFLPVSPMRGGHLLKFHFPRIALFDPQRAEMLVARRRALVFRWWHTIHSIVSNNGNTIADGQYFYIVGQDIGAPAAQVVDPVLAASKFAVKTNIRIIIGKSAFEERRIALLRCGDEFLLIGNQGFLQRR